MAWSSSLLLLLGLSVAPPAAAGDSPTAWYDPDEVAAHSTVFAAASQELAPRYEALEDALRDLGPAVADLELGTLLAGDRLAEDTRAYAESVRRAAVAAHVAAQAHVDFIQDGYARVFGDALNRAIEANGDAATIVECRRGGGIASMMGRGRHCEGTDLNATLARAMDADPELAAAVAEINARPWPEVQVTGAPQPVQPLTGTGSWVQLATLARALWQERLDRRADELDRALAPLEEGIEAGEPAALARASELRADYEAALAADGEVLLALVEEALSRKARKGGGDVGFCVNPVALGGCPGADRTDEIIALVADDRRVVKGLQGLP